MVRVILLLGLAQGLLTAADLAVWAIDDVVRVNPETGKVFEDNARQLPRGLTGDYRAKNAVWTEMLRLLALKDGGDSRAQQIAAKVCGVVRDVRVYIPRFEDDQAGVNKPYEGIGGNVHWSHDPVAWSAFHRALGDAIAGK